jgi:hypothetical protein
MNMADALNSELGRSIQAERDVKKTYSMIYGYSGKFDQFGYEISS